MDIKQNVECSPAIGSKMLFVAELSTNVIEEKLETLR
tara:strand:+ start:1347 stop:1457 length:111 start_codon:yes stop_codon:yes gene_type:complete